MSFRIDPFKLINHVSNNLNVSLSGGRNKDGIDLYMNTNEDESIRELLENGNVYTFKCYENGTFELISTQTEEEWKNANPDRINELDDTEGTEGTGGDNKDVTETPNTVAASNTANNGAGTGTDNVVNSTGLNLLSLKSREQVPVEIDGNGYKFTYNPNTDTVLIQQDGFARVTSLKNGASWTTDTGAVITFDELKAAIQSNNSANITQIFEKAKNTVEFQVAESKYGGFFGFGATNTTTTIVTIDGCQVSYTHTTNASDGSVNTRILTVIDKNGNRTTTRNDGVNSDIANAMLNKNEADLRKALRI